MSGQLKVTGVNNAFEGNVGRLPRAQRQEVPRHPRDRRLRPGQALPVDREPSRVHAPARAVHPRRPERRRLGPRARRGRHPHGHREVARATGSGDLGRVPMTRIGPGSPLRSGPARGARQQGRDGRDPGRRGAQHLGAQPDGVPPAARNAATSSSVRPPSGPTTTTMRPGRRHRERGQRRGRLLVEHDATAAVGEQRRRPRRWSPASATSGNQARRACLAASRAVPRHRASDLAARSPRHTATDRAAAHGTIVGDADLGEHLDGELAAVALGQRLHDGDRRVGLGHGVRRRRPRRSSRRLPVSVTVAVTAVPRPVGQHDLLADAEPAYGDRVVRLVARSTSTGSPGRDAGQRRDPVDRQRQRHRLSAG